MIQKLFPPLGVVSQKLLHCAGQATELSGRNLAESFWVGRIKLCWLTATGCKRVLLLKKMGKKVRTTWADMVQFFWVNSACVYREKYVHNLVEVCFAIYNLYFELSCCQHPPFAFQGFMFIAKKTDFWLKLESRAGSDIWCDLLHRLSTAHKIYLLWHYLKCTWISSGFLCGLLSVWRNVFVLHRHLVL